MLTLRDSSKQVVFAQRREMQVSTTGRQRSIRLLSGQVMTYQIREDLQQAQERK